MLIHLFKISASFPYVVHFIIPWTLFGPLNELRLLVVPKPGYLLLEGIVADQVPCAIAFLVDNVVTFTNDIISS